MSQTHRLSALPVDLDIREAAVEEQVAVGGDRSCAGHAEQLTVFGTTVSTDAGGSECERPSNDSLRTRQLSPKTASVHGVCNAPCDELGNGDSSRLSAS